MAVRTAPSGGPCEFNSDFPAQRAKNGECAVLLANSAYFRTRELRTAAWVFSVVTGLLALLWDNPWLQNGAGGGPCPLVRP